MKRLVGLGALLLALSSPAQALPSFARQTGMPCQACHTTAFGPSLTPEGEAFKLLGYSLGGSAPGLPLNAMTIASFTRTATGQGTEAAPGFGDNDNLALDDLSLIYAGPVAGKVAAFAQLRYDGIAGQARAGDLDIRYADTIALDARARVIWGLSLNNDPTVQDLWNTSPAWSFPFAGSSLAPRPRGLPLLEGRLEHQLAGLSAYAILEDHLYVEAGGYRGLPRGLREDLNVHGNDEVDGFAPYWRLAGLAQDGRHAVRLGAFGMNTSLYPDGDRSAGSDQYLDFTYDATYAYRADEDHFKLQLAYTQEAQDLLASAALGRSQNPYNRLRAYRATALWSMWQAMTLTGSGFRIEGSPDSGLYAGGGVSGSANHEPDSAGVIAELAYGSAGGRRVGSLDLNYRVGLQFTHYDRFNGAHSDYDGAGRDAADNDTAFIYLWLAI